jgi:hypothetical protein
LVLLGYFRPLIEAGRIIPITPPDEFCPTCFTSRLAGKEFVHRRNALHRWLSAKYLNETEVELEKLGNTYGYLVSGSDLLLEHGHHVLIRKSLPNNLKRLPRLMQRIHGGETVRLSKSLRKRGAKIHEDYAELMLQNVFFELACSQCLGTAFLTERSLHIEALNKLSHDRELAERNHLVQEHLTALVPFVSSLRIEDLIALREHEGDAFLAFRQALTKAVEDYRKCQNRRFNARDASQLYGDVIEPGLAKLDQAVNAAKQKLLKGSAAKVVAWAGAISFGLYAGFLPKELAQAAAALGLTKILAELGSPVVRSAFARDSLATNDMYFLWRVREVARKRSDTKRPGQPVAPGRSLLHRLGA